MDDKEDDIMHFLVHKDRNGERGQLVLFITFLRFRKGYVSYISSMLSAAATFVIFLFLLIEIDRCYLGGAWLPTGSLLRQLFALSKSWSTWRRSGATLATTSFVRHLLLDFSGHRIEGHINILSSFSTSF